MIYFGLYDLKRIVSRDGLVTYTMPGNNATLKIDLTDPRK